jgi:hypothetical protein
MGWTSLLVFTVIEPSEERRGIRLGKSSGKLQ